VFGINLQWILKISITLLMIVGLISCSPKSEFTELGENSPPAQLGVGQISEVSPPDLIRELHQELENYQPQVKILTPKFNEVLNDDQVSVSLEVQDLSLYQDTQLGLGPHLNVILDNHEPKEVFDISKPLVFSNLEPGTHTLRVFAATPWNESFKNEGAYSQTSFHIFTKTDDNQPDPNLPLLTYNQPVGTYGAEPIMLDFYLTNAPLHLVAREDKEDEISDWKIRATVNGNSFPIDRWAPIYLKGFHPGKNWVKLEFLDEQGNSIKNSFNNTVRSIVYEPKGKDAQSRLIRGELKLADAFGLIDQNYVAPEPTPEAIPEIITPTSPTLESTPAPVILPEVNSQENESVESIIEPVKESIIEEKSEVNLQEESNITQDEIQPEITEPNPPVETIPSNIPTVEDATKADETNIIPSELPTDKIDETTVAHPEITPKETTVVEENKGEVIPQSEPNKTPEFNSNDSESSEVLPTEPAKPLLKDLQVFLQSKLADFQSLLRDFLSQFNANNATPIVSPEPVTNQVDSVP
jgi:hypothetical protein